MKYKKILLGVVLGLLLISFVPTVLGCATVKRSLEHDWFFQVDGQSPLNDNIGWWASEKLVVFPHDYGVNFVPIWECDDYYGYILDREMRDGRHMITVTIIVKGAPVVVETFDPDNWFIVFEGKMNYLYRLKFIIDLKIWPDLLVGWLDDDGFDNETGYVILPFQEFPLFYGSMLGLEFVSVLLIGTGKGKMVNYWNDLSPGETARLKVGAYGSAKKGYDFIYSWTTLWPLDFIKLK